MGKDTGDDNKLSLNKTIGSTTPKLTLGVKRVLDQKIMGNRSKSGTTVEIRKRRFPGAGPVSPGGPMATSDSYSSKKLTRDEHIVRLRALHNLKEVQPMDFRQDAQPDHDYVIADSSAAPETMHNIDLAAPLDDVVAAPTVDAAISDPTFSTGERELCEVQSYTPGVDDGSRPYSSRTNDRNQPYSPRTNDGSRPYSSRTNDGNQPYSPRTNDGSQPYSSRTNDRNQPYSPRANDRNQPYSPRTNDASQPYSPRTNDRNQPYSPRTNDRNQPYSPRTNDRNQPYSPRTNDRNQPYSPRTNDRNQPYSPRTNDRNQPYSPRTNDRNQPYSPRTNDRNQPYSPRTYDSSQPYSPRANDGSQPYSSRTNDRNQPYSPRTYDRNQSYAPRTYDRNQPYSPRMNEGAVDQSIGTESSGLNPGSPKRLASVNWKFANTGRDSGFQSGPQTGFASPGGGIRGAPPVFGGVPRGGRIGAKVGIGGPPKQDDADRQRSKRRSNNRLRAPEGDFFNKHSKLAIEEALGDDAANSLGGRGAGRRRPSLRRRSPVAAPVEKKVLLISGPMDVRALSLKLSASHKSILQKIEIISGRKYELDEFVDPDMLELVATDLGHRVINTYIAEENIEAGDLIGSLYVRPPVITIMGHVDHGKTTLLDAFRDTNIVQGEHGGITQHIGAYQFAAKDGSLITVVDTPGHAAFTAMRARGAELTDIVVLVVAADDGVKEQTIEAINHVVAANVPIIVAINKIDKKDIDVRKVKGELLQQGLIMEEMGGDVMVVEISAQKRINLDKLEEAILLRAELMELKASVDGRGVAVVLESSVDKNSGVLATVIVQKGSLKQGDIVLVGEQSAKVRSMLDCNGVRVKVATPSMPVEIMGLKAVPEPGAKLFVMPDEKSAKDFLARRRAKKVIQMEMDGGASVITSDVDALFKAPKTEVVFIVRGDAQGSVDALVGCIEAINVGEIEIKIIHKGVGAVTESDVVLAATSGAVVVGFGIREDRKVKACAEKFAVHIIADNIIYNLVDQIKEIIRGKMAPVITQTVLGVAAVRQVFSMDKVGKIAGCYVTEGIISKRLSTKVRLVRDSRVVYEGLIRSLKRFKEDAKEVRAGYECGIMLDRYDDIKPGDLVELLEIVEHAPEV